MSKDTLTPARPCAAASVTAMRTPPTTGAGTLKRSSQDTRLTRNRPAKNTTNATSSV